MAKKVFISIDGTIYEVTESSEKSLTRLNKKVNEGMDAEALPKLEKALKTIKVHHEPIAIEAEYGMPKIQKGSPFGELDLDDLPE